MGESGPCMTVTRLGNLALGCIAFLIIICGAVVMNNPSPSPLTSGIRFAGLAGFVLLVVAAIMTPWSREIYHTFGTSFTRFHHIFALGGLLAITLHPSFLAIRLLNAAIFVPRFGSGLTSLANIGRLSLILIYLSVAVLFLRRYLPKYWRVFHALIWGALALGIIHGTLIGTDMKNPVVFVLINGLAIVAIGAFIVKRLKGRAVPV